MIPDVPAIDERSFDDLMREAEARLTARCPDWTDFGPGDPGRTLVEVFAYITETLIWRANRLPARAYYELFRICGLEVIPPAAAIAVLRFTRTSTSESLSIPAGTAVLAEVAGQSLRFETLESVRFAPGATGANSAAAHATLVAGELLGISKGEPGQAFRLARPPALAPTGGGGDLFLGVAREVASEVTGPEGIHWQGRPYDVWTEVPSFVGADPEAAVFTVDRASGLVRFGPAARLTSRDGAISRTARAMARVPAAGREVRAWYRIGGGEEGNLPAGALTKLEKAIPGVTVTNPQPATGGRNGETLENALARAPYELAAADRAVTARDYEVLAQRQPDVSRAFAQAPAERWVHAPRGHVEVILTPYLPESERLAPPTRARLEAAQSDRAVAATRDLLAAHRTLGAQVSVHWARYKPVRIHLNVALNPVEDADAVSTRLQAALDRLISPLPPATATRSRGWTLGAPLRSWHINEVVRREPAIAFADDPLIEVVETPSQVCPSISADACQPGVWYAAAGDAVYRTLNDGDGWELAQRFVGTEVAVVAAPAAFHKEEAMAGLVAVITAPGSGGSGPPGALWVSRDCGESWSLVLRFEPEQQVSDIDFLIRDAGPTVLMAARDGLREITIDRDRNWRHILVDPAEPSLAVSAIATARNPVGSAARYTVMVSADGRGLFYSPADGLAETFKAIGPSGHQHELFRVLKTHEYGGRAQIFAGIRVPGSAGRGPGCFEYRIHGRQQEPPVIPHFDGWNGESCRGLAFKDELVLAATHDGGVQWLSLSAARPRWEPSRVDCGLPQRSLERLQPIASIAANARLAMAAPEQLDAGRGGGVYRSTDGIRYEECSQRLHRRRVTLPPGWLFCVAEGGHVINQADTERDEGPRGGPGLGGEE